MSASLIQIQSTPVAFEPRVIQRKVKQVGSIQILSGVPIPPPWTGRPKCELRLAMEALQVGQSFEVSKTQFSNGRIKAMAKYIGIKVACRLIGDVRGVWRTK